MKYPVRAVAIAAIVAGLTMLLILAPAGAQPPPNMQNWKLMPCPHFVAAKWTKPNQSPSTGNHYTLALTNETDCAQATTWAQKLTKGNTTGAGVPYEVKGGPPGYKCYITPDGSGGALGGSCRKKDSSGKLISAFDWLATED
ncbi:MAG: hypothetical protein JO092_07750 [Candidatus Eremiobacteraeota bacterium]|nr:hypothetical protein [Candidatus Eremiobacteraeota bacterium]